MPPIVSELIKLSVSPGFTLDSPNFAQLRKAAVANGAKEQYYGTCTDHPNTLLWVIQWPADKGPLESPEFRASIKALDVDAKPISYHLPFAHESLPRAGLTAPLCDVGLIQLKSTADKKSLAHSLNKILTDCYYADGFIGGHWSTASNDDNMNYYYLGWENRDLHTAYTKSDLFALELNKLVPHMDGPGGAYFVKMTQELS